MTQHVLLQSEPTSNANEVLITLSGELSLQNSKILTAQMLEAIEPFSSIIVHIANETAIDISCIQLLYALRKSCVTQQKKLRITHTISDAHKALLENAGIEISTI